MNAERKAAFSALAKKVKAMSESDKVAFVSSRAIVNTEGKALSLKNACLLLYQSATVPTVVGGYRQWQRAGRQVQKGEHGLAIWYPSRRKGEEGEEDKLSFFVGTVFDISQTKEREA